MPNGPDTKRPKFVTWVSDTESNLTSFPVNIPPLPPREKYGTPDAVPAAVRQQIRSALERLEPEHVASIFDLPVEWLEVLRK